MRHAATTAHLLAPRENPLDCQRCGACCCNPSDNRAEGFGDWIEIEARAVLLKRRQLADLVVRGADGRPHLRLREDGRCAALQGRVSERVHCRIYSVRPRACRRVQPGDPDCLAARRDAGDDRSSRRLRQIEPAYGRSR
jgi:hypothetical protein